MRAKVDHPFLIVKRDFGCTKTRYRGFAKNCHHLQMLFASANWLMRPRRRPDPGDGVASACRNRTTGPRNLGLEKPDLGFERAFRVPDTAAPGRSSSQWPDDQRFPRWARSFVAQRFRCRVRAEDVARYRPQRQRG